MTNADAAIAETDPDRVDEAWEGPSRATPGAAASVLSVVGFEGLLDWLLEMVRAPDQPRPAVDPRPGRGFADAMEVAFHRRQDGAPVSLAQWGDRLVMAAQLAELRLKLLLPVVPTKPPDLKEVVRR